MHNFIKITLLSIILTLSLQAKAGLSQPHLVSLYPEVSAQAISVNSSVEIEFDSKIIKKSVKNNTIVLKSNGKKIKGKTTIKNSKTLLFTPKKMLKTAKYKVKVKRVKLRNKENKKIYKNKDGAVYKVCNYLCTDIDECILPKCGKKAIKTKKIKYFFSVDSNTLHATEIKLDKQSININEDNTTNIKVTAIYDDNSIKDITDKAEWIISDNSIISIDKNIITPNKEGTITLQARYNNRATNEIKVTVYKEINGYRLPPEPDPTINNSTLLGIDSNDNIVRDDIERWIYKTYNDPIEVGLFMQSARAYQLVIEDPSRAKETTEYIDDSYSCEKYMLSKNVELNKKYEFVETDKELQKIQFNTIERHMSYQRFNAEFSGEVFGSPEASKDKCEFDENGILGELK